MIICQSETDWVDRIVATIASRLKESLELGSRASLCVSGGGTPKPIYKKLSQQSLDWAQIDIALVDERWVENSHKASNEKLIRETLLINEASSANFLSMKTADRSPANALLEVNQSYAKLSRPFDVVILGMGSDGHTASLFPYADGLEAAMNSSNQVEAVTAKPSKVTGEYLDRMTLTGPSITSAKSVILAIRGDEKKQTYEAALNCDDVHLMPVKAFIGADNFQVYWTAS